MTKGKLLRGTDLKEVESKARQIYYEIKRKSKRKPYIRSAYFKKEKIFFDFFWVHLNQKNYVEKFKRLKHFTVAIDLIKNSKNKPVSKINPNKRNEILHRFYGKTREKEIFCVQIKENKKSGHKYLLSAYKPKKTPQ